MSLQQAGMVEPPRKERGPDQRLAQSRCDSVAGHARGSHVKTRNTSAKMGPKFLIC